MKAPLMNGNRRFDVAIYVNSQGYNKKNFMQILSTFISTIQQISITFCCCSITTWRLDTALHKFVFNLLILKHQCHTVNTNSIF